MRLLGALLAVAGIALSHSALAQAWKIEQLMASMALVRSERAYFQEEKHLEILDQPTQTGGQLAYRAPDYLLRQTVTPTSETLEVDGEWLQIDNEKTKERVFLPSYPFLQALVEAVRSTMAGDLDRLKQFYSVRLEGAADAWTLLLDPLQREVARHLSRVVIRGRDNRIASVETIEANGDRSIMTVTISNIE
ncbi:MAG: outer membrane lipoprotein carrier protein LolA [Rhodospirillales bacterium]|nr:outer membrane lipoprotein carrier protein LolA [Rhodospirillales bacterium]